MISALIEQVGYRNEFLQFRRTYSSWKWISEESAAPGTVIYPVARLSASIRRFKLGIWDNIA